MSTLQTINLEVHFVPEIAEKVAKNTTDGADFERVTAELRKSGAFDYGNGTATGLTYTNLPPEYETYVVYDTRYVSVKDFRGLVKGLLEDRHGEYIDHIVWLDDEELPYDGCEDRSIRKHMTSHGDYEVYLRGSWEFTRRVVYEDASGREWIWWYGKWIEVSRDREYSTVEQY